MKTPTENQVCVKCGEAKEAIAKYKLICGSVDSQTGELNQEYGRHRYRPYSDTELRRFKEAADAEAEYIRYLLTNDKKV